MSLFIACLAIYGFNFPWFTYLLALLVWLGKRYFFNEAVLGNLASVARGLSIEAESTRAEIGVAKRELDQEIKELKYKISCLEEAIEQLRP